MKKLLAMLLALMMVLSLAACGAAEETYTLGLGTSVSTGSTKEGNAQVDATFAAVVTDADGKIVAIDLDVAQSKIAANDAGVFSADNFDNRTKTEKEFDYNMAGASPIGKEWFEQADAYCAYLVGKTADAIGAMELVESNGHMVSTDETLAAGCTMSISSYNEAVVKAAGYAD